MPASRRLPNAAALSTPLLAALALACASRSGADPEGAGARASGRNAARPDSAAFVTRLGADTLVVERFVRTPRRVEAEVVSRAPRTARTRYTLDLTPTGELARLVATTARGPAPARVDTVTRAGDSLRLVTHEGSERRVRSVAAGRAVLPFVDMVHWPYEVALMRARRASAAELVQPLLTGDRVTDFGIGRVGADTLTITHPLRGTMRAAVDADGRLLGLDAGATTRKLVVERRPWLSEPAFAAFAKRWAAAEAAGRGVGALSGRAQARGSVGGATIEVDYGTPSKRGREVWGILVPYGAVWRTGANRATHFTTSHDLVFGTGGDTLRVPAGRYTLFSIPQQSGGHLIVNRETEQAGTAHDPARDLGRVPLSATSLDAPVEVFTILVEQDPSRQDAGALRLRWDTTELMVPFVVRRK